MRYAPLARRGIFFDHRLYEGRVVDIDQIERITEPLMTAREIAPHDDLRRHIFFIRRILRPDRHRSNRRQTR